jgi:hypothetical protein
MKAYQFHPEALKEADDAAFFYKTQQLFTFYKNLTGFENLSGFKAKTSSIGVSILNNFFQHREHKVTQSHTEKKSGLFRHLLNHFHRFYADSTHPL